MSKQKRARPSGSTTDNESQGLQVEVDTSREKAREPKRPPRLSMQAGLKLQLSNMDQDKYHYAWILDKDGKLEHAKACYYEHHQDDGKNDTWRQSGPFRQYAMKLPLEYWYEDQKLKNDQANDTLKAEQALKDNEYIPGALDGRKHVLEKDEDYDPLG